MAILNYMNCASDTTQTALPDSCTNNPDLLEYALAVPAGTVWTATQLAALQTTIQAGLVNDTYGSAYHLFGKFEGIDDQSEERQQETLAYGTKTTTRPEQYYWTFRYLDGYMCKHKAYLAFKGREAEFDFFFIDKSRNYIGTEAYDADGFLTGMKGVSLSEFYENNWKPKDGSNQTMFNLSMGIANSADLNERYAFATAGFDIEDLNMTKNAVLNPITTLDDGALTCSLLAGCGGQNLAEQISDFVDATLFTGKNTETGASVALDALTATGTGANTALVFDWDETDPNYPAAGEYLTIEFVAPSAIYTATGQYYRGNTVTIEEQA